MTEAYVGEIALFAFDKIPQNWVACDGSLLNIRTYAALYSLLGTQFGGDGSTNFRLPDLRGRVPMGQGRSPNNYTYTVGTYGGAEGVALNNGNLPSHAHTVVADATNAATTNAGSNYFANVVTTATDPTPRNLYAPDPGTSVKTVPLNPASVSAVGAGAAHNNMQPFLTLVYCICTAGIYPPRT